MLDGQEYLMRIEVAPRSFLYIFLQTVSCWCRVAFVRVRVRVFVCVVASVRLCPSVCVRASV